MTTFKHISVHMVHILARLAAKRAVQQQLRDEGVRVSLVPPPEVSEQATAYVHNHPEVRTETMARAHLIDEQEGQRKANRSRRPMVTPRRHAKSPTEKTQLFNTTSAIFRCPRLLNAD